MNVVSAWPATKWVFVRISRCSGIVVLMPSTTNSPNARCMQAIAFVRVVAVNEQLGDQRIVIGRHAVAGRHVRIEANARPAWWLPAGNETRRRTKILRRVLGIDAAFDGVAAVMNVFLFVAKPLAGGDANLLATRVDARNQLRYRDAPPGCGRSLR